MEYISKNPGLQHISERIFSELEHDVLLKCQDVNTFWKNLLKKPIIWLNICLKKGLRSQYYQEWLKLIQNLNDDSNLKESAVKHLRNIATFVILNHGLHTPDYADKERYHPFYRSWKSVDFSLIKPYIESVNSKILDQEHRGFINIIHATSLYQHVGIPIPNTAEKLNIFISFHNDPNASDHDGHTPIQKAVSKRILNLKIIKILASLCDNPNLPYVDGTTPIRKAVKAGDLEIVKILAPLTDDPNAHFTTGSTPIQKAVILGNADMVRILAPLCKNPNAPWSNGMTPIQKAFEMGNSVIQEILRKNTYYHLFEKKGSRSEIFNRK